MEMAVMAGQNRPGQAKNAKNLSRGQNNAELFRGSLSYP